MTPLIVSPALARRVREGSVTAIVLPLHRPEPQDVFTEIVRRDDHIRIYFNNYQLGFHFRLTETIGFKEDFYQAAQIMYASDYVDEPARPLIKWLPGMTMPQDLIRDIYPMEKVEVVKQAAFDFTAVGCLQHETQELFPTLKNHPYCLCIHLNVKGGRL